MDTERVSAGIMACITLFFVVGLGFTIYGFQAVPYSTSGIVNSIEIYRSDWFVRPSIRITLDGKQYLLEEEAIGNAYSDIEELYTELDAVYSVGNIYFELVVIDNLQSSTILSLQIGTETYTDYESALSGFQKDLRKQASLLSAAIVLAVWMTIGISRGKWKNIYRRTFVG